MRTMLNLLYIREIPADLWGFYWKFKQLPRRDGSRRSCWEALRLAVQMTWAYRW